MPKQIAIQFECENAAFGETPAEMNAEIVKVLTELLDMIERGRSINPTFTIRDGNGNKIGFAMIQHQPIVEIVT